MLQVDYADEGLRGELDGIDAVIMAVPLVEEMAVERAIRTLSLFNTQPHLLDKFIPRWVRHLGDSIRKSHSEDRLFASSLFHSISIVRGLKQCISFLPNELDILEELLEAEEPIPEDADWRVKYTLFSWIAILAKQPFNFKKVLVNYEKFETLLDRAKEISMSCRPEKRPATLFLANTVYSDAILQKKLLDEAVEGKNFELLYRLLKQNSKGFDQFKIFSSSSNTRDSAKWKSKLLPILLATGSLTEEHLSMVNQQITQLLFNKDVSIREQMAKSLSKIKLEPDFIRGLVSTLPTKTPHESDLAVMHGMCMVIGYGILRRKIDVSMIIDILANPLILCLQFDYCKGTFSVGPVVRDAACFVVWAWAKRQAHCLPQLVIEHTLATAVLDREVVLRRAAAAAFQEAIGRGFNFEGKPEIGLQIISIVNYYSVSNDCTDLFVKLYHQYPHLQNTLSTRLTENVMPHWSEEMRRMAAAINKECCCIDMKWVNGVLNSPIIDLNLFHSCALCYHHSTSAVDLVKLPQKFEPRELGAELLLESFLLIASKNTFGPEETCLLEQALSFRSEKISKLLHSVIIPKIVEHNSEEVRRFLSLSLPKADKTTDPWTKCNWIRVFGHVPEWYVERLPSFCRLSCNLFKSADCRGRVACLHSLHNLITRFGQRAVDSMPVSLQHDLLQDAFLDYTMDQQEGDIGSLVRLQTIEMVPAVMPYCDGLFLQRNLIILAVGRLDRVRERSIHCLQHHFKIDLTEDPFEYLHNHPSMVPLAMDGLIWTASSVLMTGVTKKAIELLKMHPDLVREYSPVGDRLCTSYRLLKVRLQ